MAGEKNFENRLKEWLEAEGIHQHQGYRTAVQYCQATCSL